MIEIAIAAMRWLQYFTAAILCGSSLFFVYAVNGPLPPSLGHVTRRLLMAGAGLLGLSSLLAIGLQASLLAGSFAEGFAGQALGNVVTFLPSGKAALARTIVAGIGVLLLALVPIGRGLWLATGSLGTVAAVSLAWMGHAGAGGHLFHLAADILHAVAAAIWIGALFALVLLTRHSSGANQPTQVHQALLRFSRLGIGLVLTLAVSGAINSWYLVGPAGAGTLPANAYGQLLLLKLLAFCAMLALAVLNRYRHTPALVGPSAGVGMVRLRRSILLESAIGVVILGLVAWLGTLEPPGLS